MPDKQNTSDISAVQSQIETGNNSPETLGDPEYEDKDTVLELRDVTVTFDMERGASRVLDDVSLNIARDDILGVVGESGSGKSMFASALLDAVVAPGQISGEVNYYPRDGEPIDILDLHDRDLKNLRWEEISMVFQGAMSSFNPTMKVEEHFEETIHAHRANYSDQMKYAYELLDDFHLNPEQVMSSYPHELSGGMKQRALVALSLFLEPEILIMDEPTSSLDLLMQRSILALLRKFQEKHNLTIIFITHNLPLIAGLADRLGIMYAFEFIEHGPTTKIIKEASHPYTRALLRSVPSIDIPVEQMRPIEGDAPDPVNTPQGCSYHPRCPLSDKGCVENNPEFRPAGNSHEVACHYWEEAKDTIPYKLRMAEEGES